MNNNELNNLYGKVSIEIDRYIHAGDIDNLNIFDQLCNQYIIEYPQIAFSFWYCKANIASALLGLINLKIEPQD